MFLRHKNTKYFFYLLFVVIFCIFFNANAYTQVKETIETKAIIPNKDTSLIKKNTRNITNEDVAKYDSIQKANRKLDSITNTNDTFSVKFSKDSLEFPVKRDAIDSAVYLVKENKFILYGKATTNYSDNNIDAEYILFDSKNETLFAKGLVDSTGKIAEQVILKMGDQNVTADSVTYNTKTSKAVSHNSRTKNDELYLQSEKIKLLGDRKSFYGYNNKFTTCNLDEPHFCFHTPKMKVINGQLAVSNFAYPEFEGVPFPIGIPFGIYPMKKGRHGGLLPPQFATNETLGIGLEGLGYYVILNEYWDLVMRTNIYSYGSWNLAISPTYRKRYRYNGSFNLNIQNSRQNFKGDADFVKDRSFNLTWSHSADTRARPGVTFSSNVNAGKSSFNQLNNNNPFRRTANRLSSSINWSKTWTNSNITVSANHNQNTADNSVQLNLPEINYSLQTFYPFANKNSTGTQKWYEKIGVAYNGNLRTQMSFKDNNPIKEILKAIRDTFQWGASHNIPITLALPSLGPFQVSPSVTYEERTYGVKLYREWDSINKRVDTKIQKGIFEARQMAFSLSFATALFGTYNFKKRDHGIVAIRHVIRPNMSINYTPKMNNKYYQNIQLDTTNKKHELSVFERNLYSPFGNTRFGGMGFGVDNNIEYKTKKKGDTTSEGKRNVKLIDGFSITSGYNFLADSLKLSSFNINVRSSIANGKVNITAGANLDPYITDNRGYKINKFVWNTQKFGIGSFGRFVNANLALSTQFKGGDKTKDKKDKKGKKDYTNESTQDMNMDEQRQMSDYVNNHPAEFVDFSIPWDVGLSFALNLDNAIQPDYTYKTQYSASLNFNGNFALTPKWQLGANGYYDFRTNQVQQIQMFITREMHCWQLSINVVPISAGGFKSFNISLHPKAGILRDLKVNRTRYFYGG